MPQPAWISSLLGGQCLSPNFAFDLFNKRLSYLALRIVTVTKRCFVMITCPPARYLASQRANIASSIFGSIFLKEPNSDQICSHSDAISYSFYRFDFLSSDAEAKLNPDNNLSYSNPCTAETTKLHRNHL